MYVVNNFIVNSLSVATGLLIYSFFIYLGYIIFLKEKTESLNTEQEKVETEKEKEKVENFDILEDVE